MAENKQSNRGLGSKNISANKKHEIQSAGGRASHGGGRKKANSAD